MRFSEEEKKKKKPRHPKFVTLKKITPDYLSGLKKTKVLNQEGRTTLLVTPPNGSTEREEIEPRWKALEKAIDLKKQFPETRVKLELG